MRKQYFKNFVILMSLAITGHNLYFIYQTLLTDAFTADEFQHAHLSWNVFQGLTIYKDFFDLHGPLYPWLNSLLFKFRPEVASFETLYFLRQMNFLYLLIILALIYLVSKRLFSSHPAAFLACAIFSMWSVTQQLVYRIKADTITCLLILIALLILFVAQKKDSKLLLYISGIVLGIVLGFNVKCIFILVAFILNQLIEAFIQKNSKPLKAIVIVILGIVSLYSLIALYFYSKHILSDFLYYNFLYGIQNVPKWDDPKHVFQLFTAHFIERDLVLVLISFCSLAFIKLKNTEQRLIAIFSIISVYGHYKGLRPYFALCYLPFWSILSAYCLDPEKIDFSKSPIKQKYLVIFSFTVFLLISSPALVLPPIPGGKDIYLVRQEKLINWVIQNIDRKEMVANIAFDCPVYIFNKDYVYFWHHHVKFDERLKSVNYISCSSKAEKKELSRKFNKPVKNYLYTNFKRVNIDGVNSCLWQRV